MVTRLLYSIRNYPRTVTFVTCYIPFALCVEAIAK